MRKLTFIVFALAHFGCGDDAPPTVVPCDPANPAATGGVARFVDVDGDGHGAGVAVPVCLVNGEAPAGYADDGDDCAPEEPAAFTVVSGFLDADGDGFGTVAVTRCVGADGAAEIAARAGDCAPEDPERWAQLEYRAIDEDLDRVGVPASGSICTGARLPEGYLGTAPSNPDCDDHDPTKVVMRTFFVDRDGDGVGVASANRCTGHSGTPEGYAARGGDCDDTDPTRYLELVYVFRDQDGDEAWVREVGTLCTDGQYPEGYRTAPAGRIDCDDTDPAVFREYPYQFRDEDLDGYGLPTPGVLCVGEEDPVGYLASSDRPEDCDDTDPTVFRPFTYGARDADLDGYAVPPGGTLCVGVSDPAGYVASTSTITDCDDADPTVFVSMLTAPDVDGDGYGEGALLPICTDGNVPAGRATQTGDCAPNDPARYLAVPYVAVDRDGDGATVPEAGAQCTESGLLSAPFRDAESGFDCNDADPTVFAYTLLFDDLDGDGIGAGPWRKPCLGLVRPAGTSPYGDDADDTDPAVGADEELSDLILLEL